MTEERFSTLQLSLLAEAAKADNTSADSSHELSKFEPSVPIFTDLAPRDREGREVEDKLTGGTRTTGSPLGTT